jgi:hypothetical protein
MKARYQASSDALQMSLFAKRAVDPNRVVVAHVAGDPSSWDWKSLDRPC